MKLGMAADEETKLVEVSKRDKIIETLSAECAAAKLASRKHDKKLLTQRQLEDSLRDIAMLCSNKISKAQEQKENSNLRCLRSMDPFMLLK